MQKEVYYTLQIHKLYFSFIAHQNEFTFRYSPNFFTVYLQHRFSLTVSWCESALHEGLCRFTDERPLPESLKDLRSVPVVSSVNLCGWAFVHGIGYTQILERCSFIAINMVSKIDELRSPSNWGCMKRERRHKWFSCTHNTAILRGRRHIDTRNSQKWVSVCTNKWVIKWKSSESWWIVWGSIVRLFPVYMIYHTKLYDIVDKYDCLIVDDQTIGITNKEYCRRPAKHISYRNRSKCVENDAVYFSSLSKGNHTYLDMLKAGAPVDIIDAYNLYLEHGKETNEYWCRCSPSSERSFGASCEYTFSKFLDGEQSGAFLSVADIQYNLEDHISRTFMHQAQITNGTCYVALPQCETISNSCLHWNQICDGEFQIATDTIFQALQIT